MIIYPYSGFTRKTFDAAFPGATLTVDSEFDSNYVKSKMVDGDEATFWISSLPYGGAWVEIDSPTSQFVQAIIVTRGSHSSHHDDVYNVCLSVDDESTGVCTEDAFGNPLLSGNEVKFEIEPRMVNKEFTLIFSTCET